MIYGANITPKAKRKMERMEEVRQAVEAACYAYKEEPCGPTMDAMYAQLDKSMAEFPAADWKLWIKNNFKIEL